mgnify:FL=1
MGQEKELDIVMYDLFSFSLTVHGVPDAQKVVTFSSDNKWSCPQLLDE